MSLRPLRIALGVAGAALIVVHPLVLFGHNGREHLQFEPLANLVLAGLFAILGSLLLRAIPDPMAHRRLIWSALWATVAWAGIVLPFALHQRRLAGYLVGVVLGLVLPMGVCVWALRKAESGRGRVLWALRSIVEWVAVGTVLGVLVFIIFTAISTSGSSCDFECAYDYVAPLSPVIGATWGLLAGLIGAFVGAVARSRGTYPIVMGGLASVVILPYGFFGLVPAPAKGLAFLFLAAVTGGSVWAIARVFAPPHDEPAHEKI